MTGQDRNNCQLSSSRKSYRSIVVKLEVLASTLFVFFISIILRRVNIAPVVTWMPSTVSVSQNKDGLQANEYWYFWQIFAQGVAETRFDVCIFKDQVWSFGACAMKYDPSIVGVSVDEWLHYTTTERVLLSVLWGVTVAQQLCQWYSDPTLVWPPPPPLASTSSANSYAVYLFT